jgi:phosphate uptake regulator
MVALPKKWVREMGLRQGSEIIITRPSLTSLLVTAEVVAPVRETQEAAIEVSEKLTSDSIFREIVSLYVLGYSQIHLRGGIGAFATTKRDAIKELVRRHLVGTEGLADSGDKTTIQVLLGYTELSVDNALKKMLLITTSMCREAMKALESDDKRLAKSVIERDEEVGRFSLYVIRQLNMSMGRGIAKDSNLDPRDILVYIQVTRFMDRIASHACRMAEVVLGLENKIPEHVNARLGSMNKYASGLVEEALLSLFKRDHVGADLVVEKAKHFVVMEDDLIGSLGGSGFEESYTLHVLIDSQKRIAEYARDIAEVVLDLTVERVIRKEILDYPRAA